jgi:hypothetical protein
MRYEKIQLIKVYEPSAKLGLGDFVNKLHIVDLTFDEEKFLEEHPCNCSRPRDLKYHQFVKMPTGVFMKCLIQNTTEGIKPDILMSQDKPAGSWIKIHSIKPITDAEARRLFATKKFVATPDQIIYLLR